MRQHPRDAGCRDECGNLIETRVHAIPVLKLALSGLLISICRQPNNGPKPKQITRNLGLSNVADWIFFFPHSRFIKRHETKTHTYQHSGSSVRVPIDGDVRSASTELGLY